MNTMPTIYSKRIILRPFTADDAQAVTDYAGDHDIAYNTLNIPHPYDITMAQSWIQTHQQLFDDERSLVLAIERIEPKNLIGAIGLHDIRRDYDRAEIGYWIGKSFWNQGYCTEAAIALLNYGFTHYNLNRILAYHFSYNPASGRVMQKIGMKHEGTLRQHVKKLGTYIDLEVYGILRGEWENLKT